MISLKNSVGKDAVNRLDDLRKVQLALLELDMLPSSAFLEECMDDNLLDDLNSLRSRVLTNQLPISKEFQETLAGTLKADEAMIPFTLEAIVKFQSEIQGREHPDGRIDRNGNSLRSLNKAHKAAAKKASLARTPAPSTRRPTTSNTRKSSSNTSIRSKYDIRRNGDSISIVLKNRQKSTKKISIAAGRKYISENYNWNGIVKLVKFAMETNGIPYILPTNLTGTRSDDQLIISDEAVSQIVKLQLERQIKKFGIKGDVNNEIFKWADGKPGDFFIKKIIKVKDNVRFMDESKNKSLIAIDSGEKIIVPDNDAGESTHYHFFRDLVRARNGLWSDLQGVINIVGLRRTLDKKEKTRYNDTLAVCWKDAQSNLRVELNIATTEPGNRKTDRQVGPQTTTVVPGFHFRRQPAGRTQNLLIQNKDDGALHWNPGSSPMNIHQGKNNLSYPGPTRTKRNDWLKFHGITVNHKIGSPSTNFDERALLEMNIVFSEIYLILSKYGNNRTIAPYQYLKSLADPNKIIIEGITNGVIRLRQGNKTKKINLQKAKNWIVNFWYPKRKTGGRKQIIEILLAISDFDTDILKTWKKLSARQIIDKITDDHMRKVIEKQIEYHSNIKDIDGLAGRGFVKTITGIRQSKAQARVDKDRIDELIEQLDDLPLRNLVIKNDRLKQGLKVRLKKGFFIHTDNNRKAVMENTQLGKSGEISMIENETVGDFSQGCQVIYDTEVFYTFWLKLLQRASEIGQVRWYYTLVDATKFKKSGLV